MAEVSAGMVKELREKTGAGLMDCKKALGETGGDNAKAEEWLRKKGLSRAKDKMGRLASEGLVHSYIHMGGKIGVLVEVNCETDFVARTEEFQGLVKDLAMHIAAANPRFVRREEVTPEVVEKEKEIFRAQLKEEGKPEKAWDKILEGKVQKVYEEICLLDQPFVKEPKKTVSEVVQEKIGKLGENINIRRFVRFQLGEGLEKRKDDLAAEIAKAHAS